MNSIAGLRPQTVASAHGPILTGRQIDEAFSWMRALVRRAATHGFDQASLDELVAAALAARARAQVRRLGSRYSGSLPAEPPIS